MRAFSTGRPLCAQVDRRRLPMPLDDDLNQKPCLLQNDSDAASEFDCSFIWVARADYDSLGWWSCLYESLLLIIKSPVCLRTLSLDTFRTGKLELALQVSRRNSKAPNYGANFNVAKLMPDRPREYKWATATHWIFSLNDQLQPSRSFNSSHKQSFSARILKAIFMTPF